MADPNLLEHQTISRRGFLKIVAACGLSVGLGASLSRHWLIINSGVTVQETRLLMGTIINLTIFADDLEAGQAAIQATFTEMERLIQILDHRRQTSALGQLNQQGLLMDAPPELVEVLHKALEIGELTGGAFDVTIKPILDAYSSGNSVTRQLRRLVDFRQIAIMDKQVRMGQIGMAISLDGLAKGRIVDGGVAVLRRLGFENILVEAGGDLVAQGSRFDGKPWEIGILSPRTDRQPGTISTVPVRDLAVATSGDYLNSFTSDFSLNHIIDPRTLKSPAELASATVIAPTAMDADALSTALMVLGPSNGLSLVDRLSKVEALLISKEMDIYRSTGFPA